ncbi:MAG: hypothetical protein VX865_03455 [Candidatus Thermoplasmatota archaeon]|nr:hypothetical protein [Candidatus Thermoplasmatota archaeon]MED5274017.1 hypothetical protein [Candidatus Thermoplasmatota archaeon]
MGISLEIDPHPADNQLFSGNSYTTIGIEFVCRDGNCGRVSMMKLKIRLETEEWVYEEHEMA